MRSIVIKLLVLIAIVAVTFPVALGLSIAIFDTGCILDLCGLDGLVYGGLGIWAVLIAVSVGAAWAVRRA